jgi:rubrerythrin
MSLSLAAERRGVTFYEEIARTTTDMQTRLHAEEFATEERGHVLALERFLGLEPY